MIDNSSKENFTSLREKVKDGMTTEEAIIALHSNEFTIIESMKFLIEEYGINLGEAKNVVSNHPVWNEVVEAAQPLHEERESCSDIHN